MTDFESNHLTIGTRSHMMIITPLAEGLLSRGYKVTAVLPTHLDIDHENYQEFLVEDL